MPVYAASPCRCLSPSHAARWAASHGSLATLGTAAGCQAGLIPTGGTGVLLGQRSTATRTASFDCGDLIRAAPETERSIIVRRFGLGGQAGETLAAIGRDLGVTRERVRQIEAAALRKLRARLEVRGIGLPDL